MAFEVDTVKPMDYGKLRVGQPRINWYKSTLQDLWLIAKTQNNNTKFATLNLDNSTHVAAIKQYVTNIKNK